MTDYKIMVDDKEITGCMDGEFGFYERDADGNWQEGVPMYQYSMIFRYDERTTKLLKSIYILWMKLRLLWHIKKVTKLKVINQPPSNFEVGRIIVVTDGIKRGNILQEQEG